MSGKRAWKAQRHCARSKWRRRRNVRWDRTRWRRHRTALYVRWPVTSCSTAAGHRRRRQWPLRWRWRQQTARMTCVQRRASWQVAGRRWRPFQPSVFLGLQRCRPSPARRRVERDIVSTTVAFDVRWTPSWSGRKDRDESWLRWSTLCLKKSSHL